MYQKLVVFKNMSISISDSIFLCLYQSSVTIQFTNCFFNSPHCVINSSLLKWWESRHSYFCVRFNSVNLKYLESCLAYSKDSIKICCFNYYFLDSQRVFKTIVRIGFFRSALWFIIYQCLLQAVLYMWERKRIFFITFRDFQ